MPRTPLGISTGRASLPQAHLLRKLASEVESRPLEKKALGLEPITIRKPSELEQIAMVNGIVICLENVGGF